MKLTIEPNPKPFLKWAGGKRQLLDKLIGCLPNKFNRYLEPFVGGGALFFHLKPQNAYISDINPELINAYQVIKNNVNLLIEDLKKHKNTEEYYYKIRNVDRTKAYKKWTEIQRASRLIFLNKTCFNGLYRSNSSGYFNVPFGFYKNPKILDEENLRACNRLLQTTELEVADFKILDNKVASGDLVYFDPPYAPLSKTSSFTKYYKDDFDADMQFELKELCGRISTKNVFFMLSNSYSDLVLDLYKDYNVLKVWANRAINCKANGRGKIYELLITNYSCTHDRHN